MIFCIRHTYACNKKRLWSNVTQIIMRLNLVILFLIAATFKVAATAYGQTITIKADKVALEQVFQTIEQQSDYIFWYKKEVINTKIKISLDVKQANLKDVLDACIKQTPYNYEIISNTIVIKPKKVENIKPKNTAIEITGKVVGKDNVPIPGVTIKVKGTSLTRITGPDGLFNIVLLNNSATLLFSFVGYETKEVNINNSVNDLIVVLDQSTAALQEVNVVSTGYQALPKERATGSFVQINNELLNRRVSSNILDRLEGVASGVLFPNSSIPVGSNESPVSVRGRSTIYANAKPLIVVDNFPFQGDISTINPNDIESITILKDAAAASIWGAFSGNGVIVINTKKGALNTSLDITYNGNVSFGDTPDLKYSPQFMDSKDYIDVEKLLFSKGFYDGTLGNTSNRPLVSPVVELLDKVRKGTLSNDAAQSQISRFETMDYRADMEKYLYQNSLFTQHSLSLRGGTAKVTYLFSGGYDYNRSNLVGNSNKRQTFNTYDTFVPIKNLELNIGLTYTNSPSVNNNPGYYSPGNSKASWYPYMQLVDENGKPLPIEKDYRLSYIQSTGDGKLLDWTYNPLSELNAVSNTSTSTHIRLNSGMKYTILPGLSAEVRYQYERSVGKIENLNSVNSYFTRNLINRYTQVTNTVVRPIPLGGIIDLTNSTSQAKNVRGQINYQRDIKGKHSLTALAGAEYRELVSKSDDNDRLYGYNQEILKFSTFNPTQAYPIYGNLDFQQTIPYFRSLNQFNDEYISYFGNASYDYDRRYIVSASARLDQSNIFGATTNNRGVPLWSVGAKWNINNEKFYRLTAIPNLSVRATYGYNGNIDRTVSAILVGAYGIPNSLGLPVMSITNPPNPELRWERTATYNLGLDFSSINNIVSGSIEYYRKKGKDLIGFAPVASLTGFNNYKGNVADMSGDGLDIVLNGNIKISRLIHWNTDIMFSYNVDKVTAYSTEAGKITYAQSGSGRNNSVITPAIGKPVYSVYSYKWMGLDGNGDPQGIFNGSVSKDYLSILRGNGLSEMVYHGSARPTKFGAFRNTFSYQHVSLSLNIAYKLGYYFRRSTIDYGRLVNNWAMHADYANRWQQSGDELKTNVPAFVYPANANRDYLYTLSEATVEKGDHIRIQDIRLSYQVSKRPESKLPFNNMEFYAYANNLGILWRSNKVGIDPDFISGYPNPRSISLGLKFNY